MMDLKRLNARMDAFLKNGFCAELDSQDTTIAADFADLIRENEALRGYAEAAQSQEEDALYKLAMARESLHFATVMIRDEDWYENMDGSKTQWIARVLRQMDSALKDAPAEPKAEEQKLVKAAAHVHTIISHVNDLRAADIYRGSLYDAVVALSDLFPEAKEAAPAEPKCGCTSSQCRCADGVLRPNGSAPAPSDEGRREEEVGLSDSTKFWRGYAMALELDLAALTNERDALRAEPEKTRAERDAANALLRRVAANTEHAVEHDALVSEIREHLGEVAE